jgi:hypothetical protein
MHSPEKVKTRPQSKTKDVFLFLATLFTAPAPESD